MVTETKDGRERGWQRMAEYGYGRVYTEYGRVWQSIIVDTKRMAENGQE